jgi:hypothetical protein
VPIGLGSPLGEPNPGPAPRLGLPPSESIASRPLSVAGLGQFLPWRRDLNDLLRGFSAARAEDRPGLVGESVRLDPAPSAWTARVAICIAMPSAVEVIHQAVRSVLWASQIPQLAPFPKRDLGVDARRAAPRKSTNRN